MDSELLWGIDLGGTKIEGAIIPRADAMHPLCRLRVPTEAHLGYEHIQAQIALVLARMEAETGLERPARIGVGTPGTLDPRTQRMKNCNTTSLNGQPLLTDLEERLGMQVSMANDANCFALAEATLGAGRGASVVFGVIMGTGVGGGLVVGGRVLNGAQGIAGEWGHNQLEPEGVLCYCGKVGCVETVLAGPALERYYECRSGRHLTLSEIVARGDDPDAQATLAHLCEKFGQALSVVVNIVDPDVIVLGGGVGNIEALFTAGRDQLEKWVFNPRLDTRLARPTLGDSAGVFGAAMLAG